VTRYAIYGFSSQGHRHCQSFHVKDFNERYGEGVRNRIQGILAQNYTRLGAAIRYLGLRLGKVEAQTHLLITLTDGRPDDIDGYRGRYGIEDTRKALMEIRGLVIHSYCITIDTVAREYLSHMYGPSAFTIIDQVDKLPRRISGIYRKLTT
jgi:nitric oxide reductase NorD protein